MVFRIFANVYEMEDERGKLCVIMPRLPGVVSTNSLHCFGDL
jgi:hypothetical protein